jgi:anaerobic magnesium-protoporphyrin IX monomethyl ester cyclase
MKPITPGKNLIIVPKSMVQEGYTPHPLGPLHVASIDDDTFIADNANEPDLVVEEVLSSAKPKVVGVPMYTAGRVESLRILKLAKEAGAVTVAGGPHVAVMTEQLATHYPFIDHLVVGDGELAWKAVVSGAKPLPRILRMRVPDFDTLPMPAWNKLDFDKYQERGDRVHRDNDLRVVPRYSLVFSRGCTGSCAFCAAWHVSGKYRHYGVGWISRYLTMLWNAGARHLVWQDDCMTSNRDATMKLCGVLKQFRFSSFGTTRIDCMDEEMVKAMADAGFYALSFGLESGSPYILQKMNKETDNSNAFKVREAVAKAGMSFIALMVQGYPYETDKERQETLDFLRRLDPDKVNAVEHTMVMPGTQLYVECKRAGLLDDNFWLGTEPYYIYRGGLPGTCVPRFLVGKVK